jgi:hypothetical protein
MTQEDFPLLSELVNSICNTEPYKICGSCKCKRPLSDFYGIKKTEPTYKCSRCCVFACEYAKKKYIPTDHTKLRGRPPKYTPEERAAHKKEYALKIRTEKKIKKLQESTRENK